MNRMIAAQHVDIQLQAGKNRKVLSVVLLIWLKTDIRDDLMGNGITGQFGIAGKVQFFHDPAAVGADGGCCE